MKAIDFTVSEHNSVSIVFIFYQLQLSMYSKGANRDYRYPVGAFFVFTDRYDMPTSYLFRKCKDRFMWAEPFLYATGKEHTI